MGYLGLLPHFAGQARTAGIQGLGFKVLRFDASEFSNVL